MAAVWNMIRKSISGNSASCLTLPECLLAALVLYLICLALFFRRKSARKNIGIALLFLYSGFVFGLTVPVVPLSCWNITPASTEWAVRSIQWVPFRSAASIFENSRTSGNWTEFMRLIVGNFIILMPFGILAPAVNPDFRFGRMLTLAVLVPIGIEALQLVGNILSGNALRTVETEDVILNASGCLFAYLIFAGIRDSRKPKYYRKYSR